MTNYAADIYERMAAAKSFIDANYTKPVRLNQVAASAALSRFHFHRIFRDIYKKTPHRYLTEKRLGKAKDLLAANTPVATVCTELGFESVGSFSVWFKKEIGFAPQYFRNEAYRRKCAQHTEPRIVIPHCFLAAGQPDDYRAIV